MTDTLQSRRFSCHRTALAPVTHRIVRGRRRPAHAAALGIILLLLAAPAAAVPPVANDDAYSVDEGGILAGDNVLLNDTDDDGDIVRANLLTGPEHAQNFNLLPGGLFFYVHDGSEEAVDTFTYEAEDALGDTDSATVTITINPVNDAPVVQTPISDQTTDENQPFGLDVSGNFFDADGDTLTFSATGLPPSFSISDDGNITGTADDVDVGSFNITVTAEDPSGESASDTFNLTVFNVNDQPLITGQLPVSVVEDGSVTILLTNLFVTDPDNNYPADFTLDVRDGSNYARVGNTITPAQDFVDPLTVPLTVTDNSGEANAESDVFNLTVTITPQNDPPVVVVPIGDRQVNEDATLDADLSGFFDDVDGDPLTFSASGLPPTLSVTPDGRLVGTPLQADVGFYDVTVTATDPSDTSASDSFQLEVVNVNDAPTVVAPIADQVAQEDTPFSLTVSGNFDDEDGDPLTFTASGLPPNLDISPGGIISGTPLQEDVGNFSVTVTASDPGGASVNDVFNLQVANVNDPPVITGQAPLTTPEDTPLLIRLVDLIVDDPDNVYPDDFTLTVFPGSNYTVSNTTITPGADFVGSLDVPVRVNDGAANSPVFVLDVTVTNVNDAPLIIGQNPDPLVVDEEKQLTITLANVLVQDADNVFPDDFTLTVLPGENYTIVSGTTIQPVLNFSGPLTVDVTVSDGDASSPVFGMAVSVTPVNDPPVIVGQNPLQTDEEMPLTITIDDLIVEDPDDPIELLTLEILDGENYTREGNTITPVDDFSGALVVPAQVSDGSLTSDPFDLTVSVAAVEDRPVIEGQLPLSTPEETPLEIPLEALIVTDPDSVFPTDFTLSVFPGAGYTVVDTTITPDPEFSGDLTVQITVNDGTTDSLPFDLIVTVTPVNDVPVIVGQQPLSTEEDTPLTLSVGDLIIDDPDNVFPDDFTLLVDEGPNYTVVGQTVTPATDFLGELAVPVTVSDGLDTSAPFVLTISVTPVNDPPFLDTPIPDQQAFENEFFSIDVSVFFNDVDTGDSLTFSASGLPPSGNISIDPQTGIIAGTPDFDDVPDDDAPYAVTVTARDAAGESATDTFDLFVIGLTRADVSLSIDVTPSPTLMGEEARWTMTVSNAGLATATNLRLTGTFAGAGLSATAIGDPDCTITDGVDGASFSCELGELMRGGTAFTVLATTTTVAGDVVAAATAAVTAAEPVDPNTTNNSDQRSVSIAEDLSNGAVQALGSAGVLSMAHTDVDGDGDADLVLGTEAGRSTEVYLGSGSRLFLEPPVLVPNNSATEGVALADFDDDGDPDLVLVSAGGQPDQLFANDGTGVFGALGTLPASDGRAVAVGDFNDDGAADIVVAGIGQNSVYVNDGAGSFSLFAQLGNGLSLDVAVDDFDGDGFADLVFANQGSPSTIYFNNAGSGFGSPVSLNIGDTTSVTVADLDGDDRPDLAFGRVPGAFGDVPSNPVLLNDGAGQFSSAQLLGAAPTLDIIATDTDADGWTDLVLVNETGTHQVWRGSVTGFSLYAEQIVVEDAIVGATGDLGNDGGADLALGQSAAGGALVFLNDAFGNLGLGDAVPPVLSLLGESPVSVPAGSTYQDAGATASDNIDGDISGDIIANSNVNTNIVGSYRVTYNVTDRAGNAAAPITRTVQVTPAAGTGGGGGGAAGLWLLIILAGGILAGRAKVRRGTI